LRENGFQIFQGTKKVSTFKNTWNLMLKKRSSFFFKPKRPALVISSILVECLILLIKCIAQTTIIQWVVVVEYIAGHFIGTLVRVVFLHDFQSVCLYVCHWYVFVMNCPRDKSFSFLFMALFPTNHVDTFTPMRFPFLFIHIFKGNNCILRLRNFQ